MTENKLNLSGGELTDLPNEHYKKFFDKFLEIETLDVKEWKPVHLIGFFSKKYNSVYGSKYKFKFNTPQPSKCFEVFQIKKLAMLVSSNPTILKNYIDWAFDKIIKNKKRITSISFLTREELIKEYKLNILFSSETTNNIDRSTPLPEKYSVIFEKINFPVKTYGDLAFIFQMPDKSEDLISAFSQIENIGFDKKIINRIV